MSCEMKNVFPQIFSKTEWKSTPLVKEKVAKRCQSNLMTSPVVVQEFSQSLLFFYAPAQMQNLQNPYFWQKEHFLPKLCCCWRILKLPLSSQRSTLEVAWMLHVQGHKNLLVLFFSFVKYLSLSMRIISVSIRKHCQVRKCLSTWKLWYASLGIV